MSVPAEAGVERGIPQRVETKPSLHPAEVVLANGGVIFIKPSKPPEIGDEGGSKIFWMRIYQEEGIAFRTTIPAK